MYDEQSTAGLVKAGWWTTVLIWPIGAIIAIILLVRGRIGHAIGMLVVCVLWVTIGWAALDSVWGDAQMGDIESSLESDLNARLTGSGETVQDITCAQDSDTHATCLAQISGGGPYSIDVRIDQNSGEYVWQVQ